MEFWQNFSSNDFLPHGYCIAWQPGLLWLHILADSFIALAYYSIPIALAYFVGSRKDLAYKWIFLLFSAFIFACGTTHVMNILTLWEPLYWLDGWVKAVTAGVSVLTAVLLWPLIPKGLILPSPDQLQIANRELQWQISERVQVEQALRRSEELYRTLAKNLPNITVLLFDHDLRYLVVEGSFGPAQNYTGENLEGQTLWDVLPSEEAEKLAPIYQAALGGTKSNFEWTSNNRIYEVQALPVRNEQGEIFAGMIVSQDITQQKSAETILRAAYEQLELRIKDRTADLEATNEELRMFTYIVSHDLRAPLVNLKGFTGELRLALEPVSAAITNTLPYLAEAQRQAVSTACYEDIPEALNFIDSAVTRMDNLINAVLKLSRLGRREFNFERVDMAALVQTTLQSLAHQIEQRQVEISVDPLPEVIADQTSMEQVMSNLLANAIVYLDPDRPGKIEIKAERNQAETIFHIHDNGRGIAEADLQTVFELFRRVGKQDVPGEGMGLAYVQTLVRRHGGRIWCTSELDIGTTFSFALSNHLAKEGGHA